MTLTNTLLDAQHVVESLKRLREAGIGPPEEGLGRADAIVASVPGLLRKLSQHFIEVPYPTPEFALDAMRLATELCVEAITTYHQLLTSREGLSWLGQTLSKALWPAAVQRVFFFGYHLAFVRRIAGQSALVPAGRLLLEVIHLASERRWMDVGIAPNLAGRHGTLPPRHLLHRMAMIAIAPLDEVPVHQIEEITHLILAWADAVTVVPRLGAEMQAAISEDMVRIGLGGDESAPEWPGGELVVDLRVLGERLFALLGAASEPGSRVEVGKGVEVEIATLELLRDMWRLQEPRRKHFLDSDAEMGAWIQALPLANPKECTRLLYLELEGLRRKRAPVERKLAFLEAGKDAIQVVLNHLRQRLGEPEFPLPERMHRLANLYYEICAMIMDGYEEVMSKEESGHWLAARTGLDRRILAAHRVLFYGYRAVFNRKAMGLDVEERFWITVHQAFKLAVEKDRFGQTVAMRGVEGYGERSFVLFYKMIILAAMLPLHQLRRSQVEEVEATLEEWAKEAELTFCTADSHIESAVVRLQPNEDKGPRWDNTPCEGCSRGYCLLVSPAILVTRLLSMTQDARGEQGIDPRLPVRISLDTLEFLAAAWGERKGRMEDRQAVNAHLEALFSVSGIHHYLTEGETAPRAPVPTEQGLHVEDEVVLHERKTDVWDYIYNWKDIGEPSWAEQTKGAFATFQRVAILDKSKHGCRLAVSPGSGSVVRIGDVLAMRKNERSPLYVGYVRWARNTPDGGVELGVRFLMSQAEARNAMITVDQRKSKRLPCLIGRYPTRVRPIIVVPFIPDLRRKQLMIEEEGEWVPVRLAAQPLDRSRSFEAYEWHRAPRGKAGPEDGQTKAKRPAWDYL